MALETRSRWRFNVLILIVPWLATLWMWRNALRTFFTSDDLVSIARAAGLESAPLTFRPLSAVAVARLEYFAFGLSPFGYHAVNLGLHLLAATGVYALSLQLALGPATAVAASIIFACSAIAFTPLHAASGIGDLLACALLIAATLLHMEGRRRGRALWLWSGAAIATLAVFAKETAAAWPLVVVLLEWSGSRQWRVTRPALLAGLLSVVWFAFLGQGPRSGPIGAYATSFAPVHLFENLATYLRWCVQIGTSMRDSVASANPGSWPVGLVVATALGAAIVWERRRGGQSLQFGALWLIVFLLPALPLANHTYLYYAYIPWVGGAVAAAALGRAITRALSTAGPGSPGAQMRMNSRSMRKESAVLAAFLGLLAFVIAEARGVRIRETATFDALPADRTIKEATLLEHAVAGLRIAALPAGTSIGFVSPVPRPAFTLPNPTLRPGDILESREYLPLQEALRDNRAIQLFTPGLIDSGFALTIPPTWSRVNCFLYEQRGWLRNWGSGQLALMRQAEFQAAMGRWAGAESSFARVRSLGDTLSMALCGQAVALAQIGRGDAAIVVAREFNRRWQGDPRGPILAAALAGRRTDPRLIQPFDTRLPTESARLSSVK